MDLDVKGMQESLEQLKLTEKPQLSHKARQRLSVKTKKRRLTASKSSPTTERREAGGKQLLNSRSMSPPVTWDGDRETEGARGVDNVDRGPVTACKCVVYCVKESSSWWLPSSLS